MSTSTSTTTTVTLHHQPDNLQLHAVPSARSDDESIPPPPQQADAPGLSGDSEPQGRRLPEGIPSLTAEVSFVSICSIGQLLFAIYLAAAYINQLTYTRALALEPAYAPWLIGSFLVTNGISVVLSGSLADLANPKGMAVASLAWLACWNLVGVFSIHPERVVLFFVVRAMIGLAIGTLCSAAMSMLGRVYKPGRRKNAVFSSMGAMIPLGFAVGAVQSGALSAHLEWIYGSLAIVCALCMLVAWWCIPPLSAPRNEASQSGPSLKDFDFAGAAVSVTGCALLISGLVQGAPTRWAPYTYALVIAGLACFVAFYFVEQRVRRPLIDNRLWKTKGFVALMIAYFMAYGAYVGGCVFYAVRFFLTLQNQPPIIAGLYLIPIGVFGSVAAWAVSKTLHLVPGHFILLGSMLAFASGPVFFLPQTAGTIYWALSFPGLVVSTFGPDLSFAAISIFITSNVSRSFQGSAGSLVITAQNLSSAVFAAIADTIGQELSRRNGGEMDIAAFRAIWWFTFAACLVGLSVCAIFVRIPKSEEREHLE